MRCIIVAGANGFMGSRLVAEAVLNNCAVVALARRSNGRSAKERVLFELEDDLTPEQLARLKGQVTVYEYDITQPSLGLEPAVIERLNAQADAVFNFVGNTNFFPKDVAGLFTTNVEGPIHLIKTLCRRKAVFNHVSTAFVSGDRSGVIYESDLNRGQKCKNHYEQSKLVGEEKVQEVCIRLQVPYTIFRPSIVIRRHFVHGKSPNLNHFYSFVGLVDILRQDAQNKEHADKKDPLNVPVRFMGLKDSTLNFVDLDYAVQAMFAIGMSPLNGNKTYHLVNQQPLSNQEFIDTIMQLYKLKGFEIVENKKDLTHPNFYERLIKRGLTNYLPYFFTNPQFDDSNTRAVLADTDIHCPAFDLAYIARATGHVA